MSLHQSQHELARVSRSSDYITSKDIHDFPNFVNDGDILIYKKDKNGTRWMAGPAPEYVNLIHNNTQTILDLSNIAIPAISSINNLIADAPEAMDTIKEITDIIGDDKNAAGSIINHLHISDISINILETWKLDVDVSRNVIHAQVANNINAINQNINSIASHKVLFDNHASNTNSSINTLNGQVSKLDISYNNINLITTNTTNQVNTNTNNIATNTTNITTNFNDINNLQTKTHHHDLSFNIVNTTLTNHGADIIQNNGNITNNDGRITTNLNSINSHAVLIQTNIDNIATNNTRSLTNQNNINVINNTTIVSLKNDISNNTFNLNNNTTKTSANEIRSLQNVTDINSLNTSVNILDASMVKIETETVTRSISNLAKINQNIIDISNNTTNITTNTNNISTHQTAINNINNELDLLMNNPNGALDSINELATLMGDPNNIGSSVITKLAELDNTDISLNDAITFNLGEIITLKIKDVSNALAIANKQDIINANNKIEIVSVNNLQTSLNTKQPLIRSANKLEIEDINHLQGELNAKQSIITDNSLIISHIANLQTALGEKQSVITENSLPQSKIFNLIATLNNKQDVVGVNDLQINHVQNLQNELNAKQDIITNNTIEIPHVNQLEVQLNQKQPMLNQGQNITIDSNTNTISTDAASQLNELSDCKSGGVNFENCLYLGTTTTGTLNNATDNIAIGLNALNRLTTGDNNIAIGHNALDKCASKTNNVAIGKNSLYDIEVGGTVGGTVAETNCTAIGFESGKQNRNGKNNTYIGYRADCRYDLKDENNMTAIGFNASVTSANTIQLGNTTLEFVKSRGKLELTDGTKSVTYPNTHNSSDGDILVVDANGVASWSAVASYGSKVTELENELDIVITDICNNDTGLTALNQKFIDLSSNTDSWVNTISSLNTAIGGNPQIFTDIDISLNNRVSLTGDQTIDGVKTFNTTINGSVSGNAGTATRLLGTVQIAGHDFTGQEHINISAQDIAMIVPLPGETEIRSGSLVSTVVATKLGLLELDKLLLRSDLSDNGVDQDISGIITFNHGINIPTTIDLSHNVTQLKDMDNTHVHSGKIITDAERVSIGKFDTFFANGEANTALDTLKELQDLIDIDNSNNVTSILHNINDISNNLNVLSNLQDASHNDLSGNVDTLVADIRRDLSHNELNVLITELHTLGDASHNDLSGLITTNTTNIGTNTTNIGTNTTNIGTNTTSLTNVTGQVDYATAYTAITYQRDDAGAAHYVNTEPSVITTLNTLSTTIATLATELQKLHGNKLVYNNN